MGFKVMLGIFGVQFGGFSFFERKEQEQQDEKGAKIVIFYGFQKLHLAFLRCSFGAFPSFTAMGICRWEWFAFRRRS